MCVCGVYKHMNSCECVHSCVGTKCHSTDEEVKEQLDVGLLFHPVRGRISADFCLCKPGEPA